MHGGKIVFFALFILILILYKFYNGTQFATSFDLNLLNHPNITQNPRIQKLSSLQLMQF
jgi:hypothetical protein